MRKNKTISKFFNLFLVFFMVISMINPVHIHAADSALKVTNSAGEECDTFYLGDPIYVEASEGSWIGLYGANEDTSSGVQSYSWCNAPTERMDIFTGTNNKTVTAGEYKVVLFADGGYTNITATKYITIDKPETVLIKTDKEQYFYKDRMDVIVNLNYYVDNSSYSWFGLYKKGENPKDVKSIYWNWSCYAQEPTKMSDLKDENERSADYHSGEYELILFAAEAYDSEISRWSFEIVAEEISRVEILPTCENDGYFNITYDDGTTGVAEGQKATNHTYPEKWSYDGELVRSHSKVCATCNAECGCKDATLTEKCTFGEGVVTEEATAEKDGVMTYTCKVCGGTYTEVISKKEVASVVMTTPVTCEQPGIETTTYTDGTTSEKTVPALGHEYPEAWTYNKEEDKHYKVCVKCDEDCACVNKQLVGDCSFERVSQDAASNKVIDECTVCGGTKENVMLSSDKTVYNFGDPIMVTADYVGNKAWIGLYKRGEKAESAANGGVTSLFFEYVNDSATPILLNNVGGSGQQRHEDYVHGEYTIKLLNNDAYDLIKEIDITILPVVDESKTVRVEPTCEKDGSITYTHTDGTTKTITAEEDATLKATNHTYSDKWSYDGKLVRTHSTVCTTCNAECGCKDVTLTEKCTFGEGVVTEEATTEKDGVMTYTCTVCGGTYTEVISKKEVASVVITTPATCEQPGVETTTYTDGTTSEKTVPALGHEYPEAWTYNKEEDKHYKVCVKCAEEENCECKDKQLVEDCTFGTAVLTKDGKAFSTCSVCNGEKEEIRLVLDKSEYNFNDDVVVSINYNGTISANTQWVGLFKKDDVPGTQYQESFYWNYLTALDLNSFVMNSDANKVTDGSFTRWPSYTAGEYKVVVFSTGGYDVYAEYEFTFKAVETGRDVTNPTCESDGKIVISYNDGTTKTITSVDDESLKAIGHTYGEFEYDGEEHQKHTKVCVNDANHKITEPCTFELTDTKEPEVGQDGYKEYTCTVCKGTRRDVLTQKVVDRVETVDATCEKTGLETTYYTDGTKSEKVLPVLGHTYATTWTHDVENDVHYKNCVKCNEECGCENAVISEDCSYERKSEDVDLNKVTYTCSVCDGTKENAMLSSDKTVYNFGDPIMVTADFVGNKAWIGLYKRGEKAETVANGGVTSLFFEYVNDSATPILLNNVGGSGQQRHDEYVHGEYTIKLLNNDAYDLITEIDITILPVLDESKTVRVEPTCEKDGSITYVYTDGTTLVVTAEEDATLKARDHKYPEKWSYDGEAIQTHSKVCATCNDECGCKGATLTEKCTFDEGKVTKEPKPGEDGIKTYTCTVCGGTKTETLTVKVVEKVEITTKPTCDNPGVETTTYTDGTTSEKVLPSLGHDYPEVWTYDASSKSHKKVCANDASHVQSENCDFVRLADNVGENEVTYECLVCTGSYTNKLIKTDKDVYEFGEPILVSTDYNAANAWVGIYKPGETFNPDAGGKASIFWYYIHEVDATQPVDIRLQRDENGRSGEFTAGDYRIVLFKDGNYNAYSHVDIKITNVETGRERIEPTCEKDGKIVVSYSDGTTKTITAAEDATLKAKDHKYPEQWSFVNADSRTHEKVCVNCNAECGCEKAVLTESCTFDAGVITTPAVGSAAGVKTYTCTVCGGTYTEVFYNKEVKEEIIVVEPTCETTGLKKTVYTDDTFIETVIPMLGHDYGDWKFDEETHKHSKVCANDKKLDHVKVEDCTFDKGVSNNDGETTYTCEVCKGSYTVGLLIVKDKDINIGEPLYVTANCANDGSWVGLYGINDTYDPNRTGGVVSFYWYYVVGDGHNRNGVEVNLLDFRNTDRFDSLTTGTYKVVLFGDGGYSNVLSEVEVHITSQTDETEYGMKLNGKDVANKASVEFNEKEIQDVVVNVSADGIVGDSWVGIYYGKISGDGDASSVPTSNYWYWVDAKEGQENRNGVDVKLGDYIDLVTGDYTVVVYGDAGYSNVRHIVYFSIVKTAAFEEILMEPTCTDWGQKHVKYEDGTEELVPIEPLGHDVTGTLTFDAEHKEHYDTCSRCGRVAEECTFDEGVVEGNVKTYTCEVCKGTYTETISGPTQPDDPQPTINNVIRVFGNTRYETSYEIANTMRELNNGERFESIIVASGKNFADALAGSYLAAKKNAPILMTDGKNAAAIKAYIQNNVTAGGTVYVLGGTAAVSDKVLSGLTGYTVKRLDGKDRYATNLAILKEAGVTNEEIIIATGTGFADSLSASASGKPILLVGKKLSKEQKAFLASVQTKQYYVIGGTSAVSAALAKEVEAFGAVSRIGGKTRYETSVMVAETFFNNATSAVVAYGLNYPDGLCGGPLAYTMKAPLILTENGKEADAVEYTSTRDIKVGIILGGSRLVSDKTTQKIFSLAKADEIVVKK